MNGNVKILVVDDEELNREMLAAMLEDSAEIIKAENGLRAFEMLEENPDADLILLDLEMPVMDGFETLKSLKRNDRWREIPVIVITADSDETSHTLKLGANDFLSKPYNSEELLLRAMNHVRTKKLFDISKDLNAVLEKEVLRQTAEIRRTLEQAKDAEYEITLRLGKAAEFRDLETGMHTRRISEMSFLLGSLAKLSEDECNLLRYASPLHDVGKVGIPDRILLKPGKLNPEEMDIMRLHTVIGGRILADAQKYSSLTLGQVIALQHHEKWDGTGYPNSICGEDINIAARIVTIVDVFDALASERPYKPAYPLDKVVSILEDGNGTFFDPKLLKLFMDNLDGFVEIRDTLMDRVENDESGVGEIQFLV